MSAVTIRSLGYRTDLFFFRSDAVVMDRGDDLVVRSPDNPTYYWRNFLLLDGHLGRATLIGGGIFSHGSFRRPRMSRSVGTVRAARWARSITFPTRGSCWRSRRC